MSPDHGGNLDAARRLFPHAPQPWIDLSTGINPHPYPIGALPSQAWTRLPEPAAVAELERVAACAYGARERSQVVAAPGTQSLIQWLPRLLSARRVVVVGPTYGEYATAWRAAGAQVDLVEDLGVLGAHDLTVVCNPNNPDGRIVAPDRLLALAGAGRALVVDEAFVDFSPELSLVPRSASRVVVLRSFGKAYGLAGLRLGFAICDAATAQALRSALGPWAVSGPAVEIGRRALADAEWREAMAARLQGETRRLDALLTDSGWTIVGGTALFRLARRVDAVDQFHRLGRAGILVRPFSYAPSWLRVGIPADEAAWSRLEGTLVDG